MLQFTKDHGRNKKGDTVESHPNKDYLLKMKVLTQVEIKKAAKKTTKKK